MSLRDLDQRFDHDNDLNERSDLVPENGDGKSANNSPSAGCELPTASCQGTSDLKWYVVQSKPREEIRAEHFLKEKGFHTFLPIMEITQTRGFKSSIKEKPLFPSYLFCRFEASDERLAQVRWTKGVVNILPESVNPTPVEDEVVRAIRTLEEKDGVIRKKGLEKNDRIRIARGPMKDILGIFDHWASDQGRVRVLLKFINYNATVVLHHSLVERVAY